MYANVNYFGIEAVLVFKIFAAINLLFSYMKKREVFSGFYIDIFCIKKTIVIIQLFSRKIMQLFTN